MPLCNKCGEQIEFRSVGGRVQPYHFNGSGWDCSSYFVLNSKSIYRESECSCRISKCPKCSDDVYFVRHNGGSIWIDPPLGPPWTKHPCMEMDHDSKTEGLGEHNYEFPSHFVDKNWVFGVVQWASTSSKKKISVACVSAQDKIRNIVVLGDAIPIVGEICIVYGVGRKLQIFNYKKSSYQIVGIIGNKNLGRKLNWKFVCPDCNKIMTFDLVESHLRIFHNMQVH